MHGAVLRIGDVGRASQECWRGCIYIEQIAKANLCQGGSCRDLDHHLACHKSGLFFGVADEFLRHWRSLVILWYYSVHRRMQSG